MFCGGRENGVYLVRGVGVRDVGPRQDDADGAGLLERCQIADGTTRRARRGRKLLIRGVQSPDFVLFTPLTRVDRALEERDLALQTLEREGWISTGKDQLAGDAGRRCLTRIRKVRRDRRLEGRAGRRCDGDAPTGVHPIAERYSARERRRRRSASAPSPETPRTWCAPRCRCISARAAPSTAADPRPLSASATVPAAVRRRVLPPTATAGRQRRAPTRTPPIS